MPPSPPADTLAAMNRQSSRPAVMAVMAAALLAAACSAGLSSTGSGGSPAAGEATSTTAQLLAYTQCMRSHGVPEYPSPGTGGQMQKITSGQQVGVSDAQLSMARDACAQLWPYQDLTQAQQQQEIADAVKFAQCMRSHGVPKFPDPTSGPDGRAEFVLSASRDGFDPQSLQILAKVHECEQGLPASVLPGSPEGVEVTTTS